MAYLADEILNNSTKVAAIVDYGVGHPYNRTRAGWFISKPVPGPMLGRLKDAWLVLCGEAEAVVFAESNIAKPIHLR